MAKSSTGLEQPGDPAFEGGASYERYNREVHGDICIDCDGLGKYPSGADCMSCEGSGRVLPGDGIADDSEAAKQLFAFTTAKRLEGE